MSPAQQAHHGLKSILRENYYSVGQGFIRTISLNLIILSSHDYFMQYLVKTYRKVASSNTSCLEAHAGFFRLLMKGIFDLYVTF